MRVPALLRGRPLLADGALAMLLAVAALAESTQPGRHFAHPAYMVPAALVMTLALTFRRRVPLVVLAAGLTAQVGIALTSMVPASAVQFLALLVAVYTVVVRCSRRETAWALVAVVGGAAVVSLRDPATHSAVEAVPTLLVIAAVVMLGRVVRRSREQAERLRALAAELAASRAEAERAAVLAERLRIAREMHDVLAHSVSVMVLQTGAARMALHDTSPTVRTLLGQVEGVGRDALDELRGILGLLRDGDGETSAELAPPQGDLAKLFGSTRTAGLPLTVQGLELVAALPDAMSLTVFRVVQEALTNAVKHAGSAPTTVAFAGDRCRFTTTISNDAARSPSRQNATALPSGGHGLTGLRERVQAVGGTLTGGPAAGGGWQVRAELPVPDAALAAAGAR